MAAGAGVETFRRIIENQGGDPRVVDDYRRLPSADDRVCVQARASGYLAALEAERIGRAAVALGAGRSRMEDAIDHGVGITVLLPLGTAVRAGDPILEIQHRGGRGLDAALMLLREAVTIADAPPATRPLIVEELRTKT
jgi:thymidine phosphorylase